MRRATPEQVQAAGLKREADDRRAHEQLINNVAARRAKLSDYDHAVYAAWELGGVQRKWRAGRGVTIESYMWGDTDVTQVVSKLERCLLVSTDGIPIELNADTLDKIRRRVAAILLRTAKRRKP